MEIERPVGRVVAVPRIHYTPKGDVYSFDHFGATFKRIMAEMQEKRIAGNPMPPNEIVALAIELGTVMSRGCSEVMYVSGDFTERRPLMLQTHLSISGNKSSSLRASVGVDNANILCLIPIGIPKPSQSEPIPGILMRVWTCILREFLYSARPSVVILTNKDLIEAVKMVVKYSRLAPAKLMETVQGLPDSGVEVPALAPFVEDSVDIYGRNVNFLRLYDEWWLRQNGSMAQKMGQMPCIQRLNDPDAKTERKEATLVPATAEKAKEKFERRQNTKKKYTQVQGVKSVRGMFSQ